MTEDRPSDAVPDSDPRHLDPAGDLADEFQDGALADAELTEDADRDELREFIERAERGEFDADPGSEAVVRIVRSLLDDDPTDGASEATADAEDEHASRDARDPDAGSESDGAGA